MVCLLLTRDLNENLCYVCIWARPSPVHLSVTLMPVSGINMFRQKQVRFTNYKILKLVHGEVWLFVFWKSILFYYIRKPSDVADPIRFVLSRARYRQNMTFHLGTFLFIIFDSSMPTKIDCISWHQHSPFSHNYVMIGYLLNSTGILGRCLKSKWCLLYRCIAVL